MQSVSSSIRTEQRRPAAGQRGHRLHRPGGCQRRHPAVHGARTGNGARGRTHRHVGDARRRHRQGRHHCKQPGPPLFSGSFYQKYATSHNVW